jgi:lysozyme family protein
VTAFEWAVEHTLKAEGVFSNHRWDPSGKTKYGITDAVARRHGHRVEDLTVPQATAIYRSDYWNALGLDRIAAASWRVAMELFDTAVNTGPGRATKIAQEALATVFEQDLVIDGGMGPKTQAAILRVIPRYEPHLVAALNGFQFAYYLWLLRQQHPAAKKAIKGWMLRLETPHPPART